MPQCECVDRNPTGFHCKKRIPDEKYLRCWSLVGHSIYVRIIYKSCLRLSTDFIVGEYEDLYLVITNHSYMETTKKRFVELYSTNLKRMESGNVLLPWKASNFCYDFKISLMFRR